MNTVKIKLDWIDGLKAFAIIGILLNHAVESFDLMPWFSNPSEYWPSFQERMAIIFPHDGPLYLRIIQFLGWLGDMGPGVFIFVSGITLTLSALNKSLSNPAFYKSRALRIYPLYIAVHLITIFVAVLYFKWKISLFWTPFSLLGLRFTNSLFWFINPSWWFIWLVIQLYFVFPFLLDFLKKRGVALFLSVTLIITLLSRSAGVLGFTFSADMDKWMTGLFGGTRLFEFSFGMYIGFLIQNKNPRLESILNDRIKLPLISLLLYITGFIASWTYFGSVFSIILITVGISGIFYSIYEFVIRRFPLIDKPLLWVGTNSFSAFLIHQSFMKYYSSVLNGYSKVVVIALIAIVSFFAGYLIEKLINRFLPYFLSLYTIITDFFKLKIGFLISILLLVGTSVLSFLMLFGISENSRITLVIFLFHLLYIIFYRFLVKPDLKKSYYRFYDLTLLILVCILFFRGNWLLFYGVLVIFSYLLLLLLIKLNHWYAVVITFVLMILTIGVAELYLKRNQPLEYNSWGELPALQTDDETIYSLIPNKLTHLKYNNYDYFVKTNSNGFTSSEIDLINKKPHEIRILILGDAFSMPEGMNYGYSYPALLEKKLRTHFPEKNVNVINAGVTGYGPNEEYAQANKFLGKINPDIVINQLFINEFEEINLTREERLKDIGLIKSDSVKKSLRVKFQEKGRMQFSIQIPFYLRTLAGRNEQYNYNKSLLYFYEKGSSLYHDSVIVKMNNYFYKMKELCYKNNSELVVLGVPGQIEVSDSEFISYFPKSININDTTVFDLCLPLRIQEELCSQNHIPYLNLREILINNPEQSLYFEKSWHWNEKGHEVIADYLFNFLLEKVREVSKK